MKTKALIFSTALTFIVLHAQSQDDRHENHMKQVDPIETDEFKVEFENVHCQNAFALGKMKITNKTADYLVFDQGAIKGTFDFGTLENEKGKMLFIDPFDDASRNFKFTGDAMHVEHFSIEVSAFSILPINGDVQEGENFKIPPTNNQAEIGSFTCNLGKLKRKTDKLSADMECQYIGQAYGIIDETKATFIYPNGNEYANAQNKQKLVILEPGDDNKFDFECDEHKADGDLQFIDMEIKWNDVFVESSLQAIEPFSVDFELDPAKTEEANK